MSPSEIRERWRNRVIDAIKQKLELDPKHHFVNSAEATDAAISAFEDAYAAAERYRRQHLGEDDDMLRAAMAHFFEHIGVLPLNAVWMVDDLFPDTKPAG